MHVTVGQPHLVAVAEIGDAGVPERVPARRQQCVGALAVRRAPQREREDAQGPYRGVPEEGGRGPAWRARAGRRREGVSRSVTGSIIDGGRNRAAVRDVVHQGAWRTPHAQQGERERSATCMRQELAYSGRSLAFDACVRDPAPPGPQPQESPPSGSPNARNIWEVRTCPGRPRPPRVAVGRPGPVPTAGSSSWCCASACSSWPSMPPCCTSRCPPSPRTSSPAR